MHGGQNTWGGRKSRRKNSTISGISRDHNGKRGVHSVRGKSREQKVIPEIKVKIRGRVAPSLGGK